MRFLRDIPIRSKLTLIIMLTCCVALVLGAIALGIRYAAAEQEKLAQHMAILTRIVATNSTSALAFNDPEWAWRTLAALDADPGVSTADVYDAQGALFASFRTRRELDGKHDPLKLPAEPLPTSDAPERSGLMEDTLRISRPMLQDGEKIGTIVLTADLKQLHASLLLDAFVVLLIVMVAGLVALLFASRLQKVVSEPIGRLATTMKHLSVVKDYSQRVENSGDDELGALICGFNEMLDQIQLRDEKLQHGREQLMLAQQIAQLGNWEWDAGDGRILLSEEACSVFGTTEGVSLLTLESLLHRVHSVDREWVRSALLAALSGSTPLDIEHRVVTDDGTIRHVHQRGKAYSDASAQTLRFVGTVQNVSERVKTQEDLRIAAKALENTVDSVLVMDTDRPT